jgi:CheY-like chemotaxis protein
MATILLCEDDPTILKLLRLALRDSGHTLLVAADGLEGLELIERERPDVVITDVAMPRMTGLELAATIREHPELSHLPIIFLSASAQRGQQEAGYRHGATVYLTKPFRTAELRDALTWVLSLPHPDSP